MKKLFTLLLGIGLFMMAHNSFSQQLVFQFKNPAFGGNTFNYQWLLSSAQAQDFTTDPSTSGLTDPFGRAINPLDNFAESLNQQILSQLSRALVGNITGFSQDGDLQDGTYEIGTFQIEITTATNGVNVSIFDSSTGAETVVTIPSF